MIVCIGRWDMLPKSWEGIQSLYSKTGKQIIKEAERQERLAMPNGKHPMDDRFIGVHTLVTFEEEINNWLDDGHEDFSSLTHWIKFVDDDNKTVLEKEGGYEN